MPVPPTVTVILPTQGLRASLHEALASVLAQEGTDFEVVVVDDSATETQPLAERSTLATFWHDPRVRVLPWHRQEGCAAAKAAGLAIARGEWVCYLDDDNVMLPGRLSRAVNLARRCGASMVLCGMALEVAGRRRRRQDKVSQFTGDARLLGVLADTNQLFHARAVPVGWDVDLSTTDDAVFFQRVILATGQAVVPNVPECLVVYRVHEGPRANSARLAVYRGQRRLLQVVRGGYGRAARRQLLCRMLVSLEKFESGNWARFSRRAVQLLRLGGWRELRMVINAVGVKLPFTRRWMVR